MTSDNKSIAQKLTKLIKLDVDAVRAYQQALDNIDVPAIHTSLSQFRDDHQRHIAELSAAIRDLGEEPPSNAPDIKGFFIEGFTAIRSLTGTEGALKAMRGNEKLTTSTYHDALSEDLPANIQALIRKNYADEQRHLQYIEHMLATKAWNPSGVPHS